MSEDLTAHIWRRGSNDLSCAVHTFLLFEIAADDQTDREEEAGGEKSGGRELLEEVNKIRKQEVSNRAFKSFNIFMVIFYCVT